MTLQEQHVPIKFAGGIETKMDSKAVPPVRLLALENGVFTKAISIKKRNGYARLSRAIDGSVSLVSDARRLATRDNELLLLTQYRCYSRQTGADQWSDAGVLIAPVGHDRPAVHTGTAQTTPDHATLAGVTVYAWEDSLGGVFWTTVDAASGRVHRAPTQANAAGERPRCVANGDSLHIYYAVPAQRQICVLVINPSSPSAPVSEQVLVDDLHATRPAFDAVSTTREGAPALLVWHEHATTWLRVAYVTSGGTLGSPGNGHPSGARFDTLPPVSFVAQPDEPVACAFKYVDGADGDVLMIAYVGVKGYVRMLSGGTASIPIGTTLSLTNIAYESPVDVQRIALTEASGEAWAAFEEAAVERTERFCVVNGASLSEPRTMATALFRGNANTPVRWLDDGSNPEDQNEWVLWYAEHAGGSPLTVTVDGANKRVVIDFRDSIASFTFAAVVGELEATGQFEAPGWPTGSFLRPAPSGVTHAFSGGIAGTVGERTLRSVGLAARAFTAAGDPFATFVHDATYFNTYLTLRLSDFATAGRHLPGSACGPTRAHLASAHVADDVVTIVLPYKTRVASANNDKFAESAMRKITLDFDSEDALQTAQIGAGLYLAAACPQHYDGRLWTEQGFHVGPEHIPTTQDTTGALTPTSTYQYKCWYEWTDAQGEVHRGPESIGIDVELTGANNEVALSLPTLRVTRKNNVRICVARSLPGDASRHWRVTSLDPTTAGAVANGYVANDPTVDSIAFIDRMSDADLQLQEQVYTVGGILSNDPVPLGSHVAVGKNRLFYTDAQAGNVVRYSKRIATGFGAEFAPELMHDVDPYGGDITALAIMDDIVYVFKASCIFAFVGDGAAEDGTNVGNFQNTTVTGFSSSQIITSDVGCTDPASIVLTPNGLLFKSAKGIYQLDRARQVSYVGAPVEAYNSQNVRRATVLPDRTAVLFLTDNGVSLYYDYLFQQWSTFTNHEGYDAAVVDNTYHYLRVGVGGVFRETPGTHSDAGARIRLRFETAWIHLLEHLQGFQRFWKLLLLGTWSSPHQLGISHRLNYDEAWSEPYWLDATGGTNPAGWLTGDSANVIGEDPISGSAYGEGDYGAGPYGGTGPDVYQWRYGIFEAGQSIQFRFEDFEKAGLAGASFELTEMTIVGGVMKPDMRPFRGARST